MLLRVCTGMAESHVFGFQHTLIFRSRPSHALELLPSWFGCRLSSERKHMTIHTRSPFNWILHKHRIAMRAMTAQYIYFQRELTSPFGSGTWTFESSTLAGLVLSLYLLWPFLYLFPPGSQWVLSDTNNRKTRICIASICDCRMKTVSCLQRRNVGKKSKISIEPRRWSRSCSYSL